MSKCACACVRFQDGFSKCCEGHPSITARPYCGFAHLAKRSPPAASRPCRTASASARPKCRFHACRWRTRVSRSSYFLFTSRRCSQNTRASCHVFAMQCYCKCLPHHSHSSTLVPRLILMRVACSGRARGCFSRGAGGEWLHLFARLKERCRCDAPRPQPTGFHSEWEPKESCDDDLWAR